MPSVTHNLCDDPAYQNAQRNYELIRERTLVHIDDPADPRRDAVRSDLAMAVGAAASRAWEEIEIARHGLELKQNPQHWVHRLPACFAVLRAAAEYVERLPEPAVMYARNEAAWDAVSELLPAAERVSAFLKTVGLGAPGAVVARAAHGNDLRYGDLAALARFVREYAGD